MRILFLLAFVCLAGCAGHRSPAEAVSAAPPVSVDVAVLRNGNRWTADFQFYRAAPGWVFTRSALARVGEQPWRPQSWTVETPGVRIERRGRYDVLVAANGGPVPRHVRIRFTPFAQGLLADYDPALLFTDGSVAIFTPQFEAFPIASVEEADRLPIDLNGVELARAATRITLRDRAAPVLHAGRQLRSATIAGGSSYVLFGTTRPIITDAMATVIDSQLPPWLRGAISDMAPAILASYAERLGPAPGSKPTFLVSWAGPTPRLRSMGGSVVSGMVVMRFEGDAVVEESASVRDDARWFIAHEGAHFWLGQAVRYQYSRDAWITEGGADLLAVRAVSVLDPAYDARVMLQSSLDDCIDFSAGRSVASAQERNEHRAYYTCGAMFGLVAEAAAGRAAPGGNFFTFIRTLVDANRADGVLTMDEWLAELTRLSGDSSLERDIRAMVETGVADPAAALASLFDRAGIAHMRDAQGKLRLS